MYEDIVRSCDSCLIWDSICFYFSIFRDKLNCLCVQIWFLTVTVPLYWAMLPQYGSRNSIMRCTVSEFELVCTPVLLHMNWLAEAEDKLEALRHVGWAGIPEVPVLRVSCALLLARFSLVPCNMSQGKLNCFLFLLPDKFHKNRISVLSNSVPSQRLQSLLQLCISQLLYY